MYVVFAYLLFLLSISTAAFDVFGIGCKVGIANCPQIKYVKANISGLNYDLNLKLYGQHIANVTVYKAIKGHYEDENNKKPLVMSFHGWTGGGKNYMIRMIANNLYTNTEQIQCFHYLYSDIDFPHQKYVAEYKDRLRMWLRGNVSRCARSIFVFDEMDHMPEGLIDSIKPYLGYKPSIDNVDYRKSIFIFLSNTCGLKIVEKCMDIWQDGKKRESLKLSEVQELLEGCARNEKSGLRLSGIVDEDLIDHFIPFLPLERDHVRKCIHDEIQRVKPGFPINQNTKVVDDIIDELQWFPKDTQLYSKSGCKKVDKKVTLHV